MEPIDLTDVPVVDNHCHGIHDTQDVRGPVAWRRAFTESSDPGTARYHVPGTVFYRRLLRDLSAFLGCEPEEETVLAARANCDARELIGAMLRAANVEALLVDEGYPPPEEEAENSFREARQTISKEGSLRLAHKPLLDTLLHVAFVEAARQEVPVQFHVGYGDSDIDLLLGNPLHLRGVLERSEYRSMPVVLLHGCYPYTRQGGYLAAIYENVYLDLSYGIPLLGYVEMLELTRAALGVAPISKLLYSSDGIGVPELHWMGALHGRRVLGQALGEVVEYGELTHSEAEAAGADILRGNAAEAIKAQPAMRRVSRK